MNFLLANFCIDQTHVDGFMPKNFFEARDGESSVEHRSGVSVTESMKIDPFFYAKPCAKLFHYFGKSLVSWRPAGVTDNQKFWCRFFLVIFNAHRLDFFDERHGTSVERYASLDAKLYGGNYQGAAALLVYLDAIKFKFAQLCDAKSSSSQEKNCHIKKIVSGLQNFLKSSIDVWVKWTRQTGLSFRDEVQGKISSTDLFIFLLW